MEQKRLKLPIGIQTFEEIRTEGYVYIDKTQYLVDMIDTGKTYFLARPRRFGKSLTISTFDALFSGKKELFKGLYAEAYMNNPNFKPSPVIRLDMSRISTNEGLESLKESILKQTRSIAQRLGIELSGTKSCGDLFGELISSTAEKYNQKVVILVDEYDKPYTDFVNDTDMANKVRDVLRDYYIQIKAHDEYIQFTFFAGISKFARFGLFSTLNTLKDISMMPEYGSICGYTEEEMCSYFPDYLDETANKMQITTPELVDKMRYYYNGFTFDRDAKVRLYNPYSTLSFFADKFFSNYWMVSGRSKLIADYMKQHHLTVEQFRDFPVTIDFLENPGDMDVTSPEGFLYQSGYLSLQKLKSGGLALDYPNTEVLNAMSKLVAENIFQGKGENYNYYAQRLFASLETENFDLFKGTLNTLLASIPYDDFSKAAQQKVILHNYKFPAQEWLYRSTILSFLRGCGVVVDAELHTHLGRPDLVITHLGITWVIEIKVAYEGETAEQKALEAYQQIIKKQYAKPYANAVCLGIGIDDAVRQIGHVFTGT